jgi:predicted transcriptional regulator
MTALTVRLPSGLAEALRTYAFVSDASINEVLKLAAVDYLQRHGRPEIVRAAFERVLEQHSVAFDKLRDL